MKILVTGAAGQVGSAILRLANNFAVVVEGRNSSQLDITDTAALSLCLDSISPDVVVNAAAYTAVDAAESDENRAMAINGDAVGNMAKLLAKRDIPLIHISTDYVFDGSDSHAYDPDHPVSPLGAYGRSKLQGEIQAREALDALLILRTSWVFGIQGNNFPKTMIRLAGERDELGVISDQKGCPTFADDIARAILTMLTSRKLEEFAWGTYHFTGSRACSWYEFACFILQTAFDEGLISRLPAIRPISTAEYPTPAKRPENSVLSCDSFLSAFPDIPLSDWESGVRALVESLKSQNHIK